MIFRSTSEARVWLVVGMSNIIILKFIIKRDVIVLFVLCLRQRQQQHDSRPPLTQTTPIPVPPPKIIPQDDLTPRYICLHAARSTSVTSFRITNLEPRPILRSLPPTLFPPLPKMTNPIFEKKYNKSARRTFRNGIIEITQKGNGV